MRELSTFLSNEWLLIRAFHIGESTPPSYSLSLLQAAPAQTEQMISSELSITSHRRSNSGTRASFECGIGSGSRFYYKSIFSSGSVSRNGTSINSNAGWFTDLIKFREAPALPVHRFLTVMCTSTKHIGGVSANCQKFCRH